MNMIRISRDEHLELLKAAKPGQPVSTTLGPTVYFDADDENMRWVIPILHKLRFPEKYLEDGAGI